MVPAIVIFLLRKRYFRFIEWAAASLLIACSVSPATASVTEPSGPPNFPVIDVDASDFDWVRDRYSPLIENNTRWRNLLEWAGRRSAERLRQADQAVRGLGVQMRPSDGDSCYGDEFCQWIIRTDWVAAEVPNWEAFSSAWDEVRPAVASYLLAVSQVENHVRQGVDLASPWSDLRIRFARDQALRAALVDTTLPLSNNGRRLFRLVLGMHVSRSDRANTEWLRHTVRAVGWPGPDMPAAIRDAAWVILLHARDDPAFRLEMLDLLGQQVRVGRMSGADFATKFDHIMWETTGTQRYGTKGDCIAGRFVPVAMEDVRRAPTLRLEVGLPTLEEQARIMQQACAP